MVALAWWLYTRGVPDEIRGLPALPDPATALAVIAACERCYFLARSGACPWTRPDSAEAGARCGTAAVRWHAGGGRVLAPPSPLPDGERTVWAHIPAPGGLLASPMALLHVLAQAVAATRDAAACCWPAGSAQCLLPPIRSRQSHSPSLPRGPQWPARWRGRLFPAAVSAAGTARRD